MNIQKFLFFLGFFLFISPSFLVNAEVVDRLEAVVNKRAIYKSDISRFKTLIGLRAKVDPLFASGSLSKKTSLTDNEIVDFLVNEELIVQKFPVTDSEVELEINGIQGNLKIDRDGLKRAIQAEGYKFEDYFKLMKVSLAKRQLLDREIRSKAVVSDVDVKNERNKSQFGSKSFQGSFHLFTIRISKKNYKNEKSAKDALQEGYVRLEKGESFDAVLKSVATADDAQLGGDLGFLSYDDLSPLLQKEVRKIGIGKVSSIIDEGKNYCLLKVTEVKSDEDLASSKENDALRGKLMEEEFQHQIGLWIERQRSSNYIHRNQKT